MNFVPSGKRWAPYHAAGYVRSYGMKLWPLVQNLSQVIELYGKNWETFWSGAGAVQVFGINDMATAELLPSMHIGNKVVMRPGKDGKPQPAGVVPLRTVPS